MSVMQTPTMSKPTFTVKKETMDSPIDCSKYVEQPWDVISSYFDGKHLEQLVRHQIESYNDFVTYQIPKQFRCSTQFISSQKNLWMKQLESTVLKCSSHS